MPAAANWHDGQSNVFFFGLVPVTAKKVWSPAMGRLVERVVHQRRRERLPAFDQLLWFALQPTKHHGSGNFSGLVLHHDGQQSSGDSGAPEIALDITIVRSSP